MTLNWHEESKKSRKNAKREKKNRNENQVHKKQNVPKQNKRSVKK